MKFCLRHCPLQPKQKSVVKMRGIVHAIFIEDERLGERTNLEQSMPIARLTREARHLQSHDQAHATQPHIGHEPLEAVTLGRRGARQSLILIDHLNPIRGPPEGLRAAFQSYSRTVLSR